MKLIDKEALMVEIEKRIKETESMQPKFDQFWAGQVSAFKGVLKILDTLEVKEAEETIKEVCEWLDNELCCYIKAQDFTIDHAKLNKDLRKHLEDEI